MNKIVRGLKAVYHGFMPVSQIKGTLIVVILIYGVFLAFQLRQDLGTTRHVVLENKQTGGPIVLNGVKHPVPYTITKTRVKFDVADPLDFLFMPSGDHNESFITALVKLIACVCAMLLLLKIDLTDPFNISAYDIGRALGYTVFLLIFVWFFEAMYLTSWAQGNAKVLGGFAPINDYNPILCIVYLWIIRAVFSFYTSAVKIRREAELTI